MFHPYGTFGTAWWKTTAQQKRLIEFVPFCSVKCTNASAISSYEWLIDVWRDHRFYAEDMLHPNQQSIEAIFSEFVESHCSEELKVCIADARAYLKLTDHRILSPRSEEAIQLQQKTAERKQELLNKYPFLRI